METKENTTTNNNSKKTNVWKIVRIIIFVLAIGYLGANYFGLFTSAEDNRNSVKSVTETVLEREFANNAIEYNDALLGIDVAFGEEMLGLEEEMKNDKGEIENYELYIEKLCIIGKEKVEKINKITPYEGGVDFKNALIDYINCFACTESQCDSEFEKYDKAQIIFAKSHGFILHYPEFFEEQEN